MQRNDLRFKAKRPDTLESKLHLWLDSRFLVMGLSGLRFQSLARFRVSWAELWTPKPGILDSTRNFLDSEFHKQKISKIPKSVLNYMGRNDKRRANYNATRNRSFRYKSFRYEFKQWNYTKISSTSSNVCAPTRETFWVNILRTSKYSLRVNKKNILSDHYSFFEPRAWTFLLLDWIICIITTCIKTTLYRNGR